MSTYEEEENQQTPAVKQVISQPLQSDYEKSVLYAFFNSSNI